MAHNLSETNGKTSMAYTGRTPWHSLGTKVDKVMTSEEAIKLAGLNYNVEKRVIEFSTAKNVIKTYDEKFLTVRCDTEEPLGVVGKRYKILNNVDAFKFFDAIVGEKLAMYHTAGALGKGERIWMLAKLPDDIWVTKDDKIEKYLLLSNSHDGSSSVQIAVTPIRVVCQNTLNIALSQSESKYNARHTLQLGNKISNIRDRLGLLINHFKMFEELSKKLVNTQANSLMVKNLLKDLGLDGKKCEDSTRSENIRNEILHYFKNGAGNYSKEVKGTAWALFNGVAEWADFAKCVNGDSEDSINKNRLKSILYGNSLNTKQIAINSILSTTGIR